MKKGDFAEKYGLSTKKTQTKTCRDRLLLPIFRLHLSTNSAFHCDGKKPWRRPCGKRDPADPLNIPKPFEAHESG